jgi:GNAT superfamily N-acetyltransferase
LSSYIILPLADADREWAGHFIAEHWGSDRVVVHGAIYHAARLAGFLAWMKDERIGLITYHIVEDSCEIVTLDSLCADIGVGSALIEAVKKAAQGTRCRRLWVVTTNDNLHALRFYQKRGFKLAALRRDAIQVSRKIKPEIPMIGNDGIPIRDEIELEIALEDSA